MGPGGHFVKLRPIYACGKQKSTLQLQIRSHLELGHQTRDMHAGLLDVGRY